MGCLRVIPGSHGEIRPTIVNQPKFMPGSGGGGRIFTLGEDRDALESRAVAAALRVGGVLLLDGLLIHRSGQNRSRRTRWAINPRYSDFFDPEVVGRGRGKGIEPGRPLFPTVHPEKVVAVA